MTRCGAFVLVLTLATAPRAGAQSCDARKSVTDCIATLRNGPTEQKARIEIEQKPTGEQAATGTATSIADFLPRFAAAAALPGLSPDFGGVSFSRNFSLDNEYVLYLPLAVQFSGALRKPTPFQPIIDTLPLARRPIVKQRLEETLGEFDDPEVSVGLTLENTVFGRRFDKHRDELSRVTAGAGNTAADLQTRMGNLGILTFKPTPNCQPPVSNNNFDKKLECFSPEDRRSIVDTIKALVEAEIKFVGSLKEWQEQSGWTLVPDLINNKPQITVQAIWNPVDAAVGIATTRLSSRWEMGIVNINSTRRYCKRNSGYADGKFTPDCFTKHVTSEMNRTLLKQGLRFFLETDTRFDQSYSAPYVLSDTASPYSLPSARNVALIGGLGGNLPSRQAARLDVGLGHIWADEDGARKDGRTWLSVTYTQKLAGAFALLTGLEYSDKAEFKNEPTQKWRANFGVRYKLITEEPN